MLRALFKPLFFGVNMRLFILLITLILLALSMSSEAKIPNYVKPKIVEKACNLYDAYDCNLVKAVIFIESRGDLNKVNWLDSNGKYSKGLMHVQELAARDSGLKYDFDQLSDDVMVGLRFGITYLNKKLKENNYNIEKGLAAYNAGQVIICKNFNRNVCYPGEFYNENYVWNGMRHYNYLVKEEKITNRIKMLSTQDYPL